MKVDIKIENSFTSGSLVAVLLMYVTSQYRLASPAGDVMRVTTFSGAPAFLTRSSGKVLSNRTSTPFSSCNNHNAISGSESEISNTD